MIMNNAHAAGKSLLIIGIVTENMNEHIYSTFLVVNFKDWRMGVISRLQYRQTGNGGTNYNLHT